METMTPGNGQNCKQIEVYAVGLCYMSVCVLKGIPIESIEAVANAEHPVGPEYRWRHSKAKFNSGESNPCPCNEFPEQRLHYLLEC